MGSLGRWRLIEYRTGNTEGRSDRVSIRNALNAFARNKNPATPVTGSGGLYGELERIRMAESVFGAVISGVRRCAARPLRHSGSRRVSPAAPRQPRRPGRGPARAIDLERQ